MPWAPTSGTVMVAERVPSTWERLQGTSSYLLTYLGIALVVGLVGSWLLSRRIKRQTRGMEPREIAGLAEHREAMLRGIAEGVIALDPQHRITLVNEVARQLLDLPEHAIGTSIDDLRIEGRLREVLVGENTRRGARRRRTEPDDHVTAARDEVVIRRGRVLVMSTMRVVSGDRVLGTVTTMRDRTALADLEREIGSFRSTAHVLRAQAHEFANQLHTISGLIQIGELDEVVRYVDAVSEQRHALDLTLSTLVRDPTIAALLMAKVATANERRVELTISDESGLERLEPVDAADVATVLGNLVDNALEHAPRGTASAPWVRVRVRQDQSSVEIVVTDSGPGIPDDLVRSVFEHGVTTKRVDPIEHGVGLALTRLVCRRRGGEIHVEREDGETSRVNASPTPCSIGSTRFVVMPCSRIGADDSLCGPRVGDDDLDAALVLTDPHPGPSCGCRARACSRRHLSTRYRGGRAAASWLESFLRARSQVSRLDRALRP